MKRLEEFVLKLAKAKAVTEVDVLAAKFYRLDAAGSLLHGEIEDPLFPDSR